MPEVTQTSLERAQAAAESLCMFQSVYERKSLGSSQRQRLNSAVPDDISNYASHQGHVACQECVFQDSVKEQAATI